MSRKIFFIHIPKTAGTSFRKAMEKAFQEDEIFYDYGFSYVETSKEIKNYVYEADDLYEFNESLSKKENIFLCGHVNVIKYMSFFKTVDVCTFVREPVTQVVSHYRHHCREFGYTKDLKTFVKDYRFQNLQSRMLAGKPLELYGFIGLTEEYEKSLQIVQHYFNVKVPFLEENIDNKSNSILQTLDEDTVNLIKMLNAEDIKVYEKAKKLFDGHLKAYEKGEKYLYHYKDINSKEESGIAFFRDEECAQIELKDEKNSFLKAKSFRQDMLHHNLPRNGFVGYGNYSQADWFNERQLKVMVENVYQKADFLRDIAVLLKNKNDFKNAKKFINKAQELRPNGPMIVKLKNEMDKLI